MKRNYTLISGSGQTSSFANINMDRDDFKIQRDSEFALLVNNQLMTTNGFTVGQRNRAFLHMLLDDWIDRATERDDMVATDDECARFNPQEKQ